MRSIANLATLSLDLVPFQTPIRPKKFENIALEHPFIQTQWKRGQVWKILRLKKAKLQELAIRGACDCNGVQSIRH